MIQQANVFEKHRDLCKERGRRLFELNKDLESGFQGYLDSNSFGAGASFIINGIANQQSRWEVRDPTALWTYRTESVAFGSCALFFYNGKGNGFSIRTGNCATQVSFGICEEIV